VSNNRDFAANGGTMRTAILGILNFDNLDKIVNQSAQITQITHFDGRCVASSVAVCVAIALILQGENNIEKICQISESNALNFIIAKDPITGIVDPSTEARKELLINEFKTHFYAKSWSSLNLEDTKTRGYTLKCVGSAFYSLKLGKSFKETLMELILEAGDADTNGAVAGALVGARIGYSNLPKDWLNSLVEKEWLETHVNRLLRLMNLISVEEAIQQYKKIFTEIQQKQELKALDSLLVHKVNKMPIFKKAKSPLFNFIIISSFSICCFSLGYICWKRWKHK